MVPGLLTRPCVLLTQGAFLPTAVGAAWGAGGRDAVHSVQGGWVAAGDRGACLVHGCHVRTVGSFAVLASGRAGAGGRCHRLHRVPRCDRVGA